LDRQEDQDPDWVEQRRKDWLAKSHRARKG
jgi:hypothetical protein